MNSTELAEAVTIDLNQVDCEKKDHLYSHSISATHCYSYFVGENLIVLQSYNKSADQLVHHAWIQSSGTGCLDPTP